MYSSTNTPAEIIFENSLFSGLTPVFIVANSSSMPDTTDPRFFSILPATINLNVATFINPGSSIAFPPVLVHFYKNKLILSCTCNTQQNKLCNHQAQVLYNILERPDLRIFFDDRLRHQSITKIALNYGLENEPNPDEHFELTWNNRLVSISPRIKSLQLIESAALQLLASQLLPPSKAICQPQSDTNTVNLFVLSEHKYYKHLQILGR